MYKLNLIFYPHSRIEYQSIFLLLSGIVYTQKNTHHCDINILIAQLSLKKHLNFFLFLFFKFVLIDNKY